MKLLTSTTAAVVTLLVVTAPTSAAAACSNEQLRVENNSTALSACRVYELVTPGDHNAQGNNLGLTAQAVSSKGDAVEIESITELPGSPVGGQGQDVARRSSTGWTMAPLEPANDEPENVHSWVLGAIGDDFSTIFLGDDADLVGDDADENIDDVFAVGAGGELSWISQGPNGGVGAAPSGTNGSGSSELEDIVGGATVNLSHVVFQIPFGTLTSPDAHKYGSEIYDRLNESTTELVGVLPNGSVPICGASLGGQQESGGAGYFGSVSQATTTIFFQSPDPQSQREASRPELNACPAGDYTPPQLYVRLNDAETVKASAPAPGVTDPHVGQEARYAAATPDGTDVLFTSKGALTSNANTDGDTTEDLYEYEVGTHVLTDVSSEGLGNGSQVQGVLGMSESGRIIYFVAHGKLTSEAVESANNLYVSDAGHLAYLGELSSADSPDWEGTIQSRSSRLTSDGTHLLLSSTNKLAAYENAGKAELYLYTLGQAGFTCISCGGAGTTATASATLGGQENSSFPLGANMTPDGATVFFQSEQALAPSAAEGVGGIYEWHEGATSLIATGGPGVGFVGASTDGSNVFFKSYDTLVPTDQNGGEAEIYDARVDGGFSLPPAPAKPCGSNNECRGVGTSLSALSITSMTPGAIGNVDAPTEPSSSPVAVRVTSQSSTALSVWVPAAGTLKLSGGGALVGAKRSASKSGTYSLPVRLTAAEQELLAKRASVTITVRVKFVPTLGKPSTATGKVTIRKGKSQTRRQKKR